MTRALVALAVVLGAALVWPATGEAGTPEPVTLTVTKEITGPGEVTSSIVVQVDCVGAAGANAGSDDGPTTKTIDFGTLSGSHDIEVTQSQPTCTVTEPSGGGAVGAEFRPTLPYDDRCQFSPTVDSMTVTWGGADECPVTIINVYEAGGGDPEPPPTAPPPAAAAPVTQATPAFTG